AFSYCVGDGNGGNSTYTVGVNVTAVNHPPAAGSQSVTTAEDTGATINVPATDADNDTLAYTVATGPAHGAVKANQDGSYTYTPDRDFSGNDTFTYTVSDGNGGSATYSVNVTVTPVNDAPTSDTRSVTTLQDTDIVITPVVTDADGDTLTYTAATGPQHGTVEANANG